MMAEMFAKKTGCCGGYGGAMHTGDMSRGMVPAIAIVGGGVPLAAGIGLSCKMRRTDNVCVAFMGDGATNEGAVHEAMNGAAIWKPVSYTHLDVYKRQLIHITHQKLCAVVHLGDRRYGNRATVYAPHLFLFVKFFKIAANRNLCDFELPAQIYNLYKFTPVDKLQNKKLSFCSQHGKDLRFFCIFIIVSNQA